MTLSLSGRLHLQGAKEPDQETNFVEDTHVNIDDMNNGDMVEGMQPDTPCSLIIDTKVN